MKITTFMAKQFSFCALVFLITDVNIVHAQGETARLEEIIVTAQRREQSIQDVPVSLTAVTAQNLESRNINDISQLYLAAPSVQFSGGSEESTNVSIRGVGTLSFAPTLESSVAIAIDDVNLGRTSLGFGVFDDVARIEALNGPQGLLFGKNASAGLLNVVTRRPELGTTSGYVNGEFTTRENTPASSSGTIVRGTLNLPTGDRSALRINARYSAQDSVVQPLGPGFADAEAEDKGLRLKFLSELSDNLELYLIGEVAERSGRSISTYGPVVSPIGDIAPVLAAEGITPGPENLLASNEGDTFADNDLISAQGTITYGLANGWDLINVTAFKEVETNSNLDSDRTTTNQLSLNRIEAEYSQFSNELRLSIPEADRLSGQLGIYYFSAKEEAERQLAGELGLPPFVSSGFPFCIGATPPFGPPPGCPFSNDIVLGRDVISELNWESLAVFGQFNYQLSERSSLIFGGRITRDEIEIESLQNSLASYFVELASPGDFSDKHSHTEPSWKLGLQHFLHDDMMLYGYYARGYKGPGFNDFFTPGTPSLVNEETSDAFELGIKSTWMDGRLVFNAAAFLQEFNDYQAQSFNVEFQTFFLENAAQLETKGLEMQLIAKPIDGLTLSANATLLDAEFVSYPGAECYPGQPVCGADNTFDASGQDLPASAKTTYTLQGMYEFPLAEAWQGFVEANYYHRSAINFDLASAPITEVGSIDLVGASIGVQTGNLRLSLFCRNCTDERYPASIGLWVGDSATYGVATALQDWGINSVRNWGVSASYEF